VVTPKDADDAPRTRITNQFRRREAMVYDLSCGDVRLTIEVSGRESTAGPEEWTVQAHTYQSPDKPTLSESGATRSDALSAVARSWAAKRGTLGFPTLDWDAIAKALLAVRAI
jgi:hypothetical protein